MIKILSIMTNTRHKKKREASAAVGVLPTDSLAQQRIERWLSIGVLAAIGLIYSITFYGHFVYFNSDFWSFWGEGRTWLSGHIPVGMKRGPFFSILTVLVGFVTPGAAPSSNLFGTEVLNAALLPTIMILVYFIAREFVGRAAIVVAILAGISPWSVWGSSEPLAELTLTAVVAATVLCMVRGSRWAYVFAMLAAVTRWDMAAAIPAVAFLDIMRNRRWLKSISYAVLAAAPFILCMIIVKLQMPPLDKEGANYLQVLAREHEFKLLTDLNLYWQVVCSFINAPILPVEENSSFNEAVRIISSFVLAAAFIGGIAIAFVRRQWPLIAVLIIAVPYVLIHSVYTYHLPRFSLPLAWFVLLMAAYAIISLWNWIKTKRRFVPVLYLLQFIGAIVFVLWAVQLGETLGASAKYCAAITGLAWATAAVVLAGLLALAMLWRIKFSLVWLCLPAFLLAAIISNNANLGFIMGDGLWQANFKTLGKWVAQNAAPDDKVLSTMPLHVAIYSGLPEKQFVHISTLPPEKAPDFDSFIRECRARGVTLIAWDSRLRNPDELYYKLWGLSRIESLGAPKPQIGPCKLLHIISEGTPKIAVYRIMPAVLQKQ
ncbi:MAG: hypothetical protein Q7T18_11810 [Sedimentisphaerales bacterium]|nr:hypothetical protein [Sedimentisphaerales bacterium]